MALIPPDAGVRMRMQTEANLLQPATPARDLPTKVDDLRPGQNFTARIQEVLPDNTYKALVAGRQLTLQLPEGAKADDVLDLVVVDRTGKTIVAKQVEPNAAGGTQPYAFAKFSPAARMIGQLLPAEGEAAPPARLNGGQPLLAQPPQSPGQAAAQLAPTLAKAVTQSGLFYEAHQAQWVSGKLPLAQLLQEPQGQRSAPSAYAQAAAELASRPAATPGERAVSAQGILQNLQAGALKVGAGGTATENNTARVTANLSDNAKNANGILGILRAGVQKVGADGTAANARFEAPPPAASAGAEPAAKAAQPVPDTLRPLVQQQLDAVATQRLAWHGEVWPNQRMDWEIEWENEREADGGEEENLRWQTSLSLTTPRLGRVDANLRLSAEGVRVTLATPYGASAADLRDAAPQLAAVLEAAGVPLLGFQVKHEEVAEES